MTARGFDRKWYLGWDKSQPLRTSLDFQTQQIHIRAQKDILGADFNPLHIMPGRDEEGRFAFTKNVDVPKN
jgi:hypothetical protein